MGGPDRRPVLHALGVMPHAVGVDQPCACIPGNVDHQPVDVMRHAADHLCGGSPSRSRGQLRFTRSRLPPMPPDVTMTAPAESSKSPATSRLLCWPRSTLEGTSTSPAYAGHRAVLRDDARYLVPELERDETLRCRFAYAFFERRKDAWARAPCQVEARHRIAMLVGQRASAFGPADDREPAHAERMQPRPHLACGKFKIGLGPAARIVIFRPVELRRAEPVLPGKRKAVANLQAALLGRIHHEEPAKRPEGLPAERIFAFLVEDDRLACRAPRVRRRRPAPPIRHRR